MNEIREEDDEIVEEEGEDVVPKESLPSERELFSGDPEEKEEEDKSEPEKNSSESSPEEEKEEPSKPTPVPGETEREKALRLEVQRLRSDLRKKTVSSIIPIENSKNTEQYQALLEEGYTEEEIQRMEKTIDVIAQAKGYMRKDQGYKQTVQQTVDQFVEKYPEYSVKNDTDDVRWSRFQELLTDGTYNLSNKTSAQLNKIFSKVHSDIQEELGEISANNSKKVAAAQHKISVASHSGGGVKSDEKSKPKMDLSKPIGGVMFKGFDEDDF